MNKTEELMIKALLIGNKYGQADKPTKIEVGDYMLGYKQYRRYFPRRKRRKKGR